MDTERRRELEAIMAQAAAGDEFAGIRLANQFRGELCGVLRAIAGRHHWYPIAGEMDSLVGVAASLLTAVAGAWRPDGALPWRWAVKRLEHLVRMEAPSPEPSLDALAPAQRAMLVQTAAARATGPGAADDDRAHAQVLHDLAGDDADVALLAEALEEVTRGADELELFLTYRVQQSQGDPSPAATVGAPRRLSAAAARKRVSRVQERLGRLVAADERFARLRGVALFPGKRLTGDGTAADGTAA